MAYLEKLLPEFRKGAKIRLIGLRDGEYYYIKHNVIYNQNGTPIKDFSLSVILSDDWELYQEPIDWDYIVKNKCLCWFWDDVDSLEESSYGHLTYHNKNILYCYNGKKWYKNCRPVRKDEVTFYEDKRDGNN